MEVFSETINDTYGHDICDRVLLNLSKRIRSQLDRDDLFARYVGDEFAILLPGQDEVSSDAKTEQLRRTIESFADPGLPVKYTISLGVLTVVPDSGTQFETMHSSCDRSLYTDKENGRNGVFRA